MACRIDLQFERCSHRHVRWSKSSCLRKSLYEQHTIAASGAIPLFDPFALPSPAAAPATVEPWP